MKLWGHRFSQNSNQKLQRFLPYPRINLQGRNLCNFWLGFWEKRWPHKIIRLFNWPLVMQIDRKDHLSSIFFIILLPNGQVFEWVFVAEFHFRSLFIICRPEYLISTSERVWAHCVLYASPCKQCRLGHAVNWIILIFCYIVHETT